MRPPSLRIEAPFVLKTFMSIFCLLYIVSVLAGAQNATELWPKGYAVIPTPRAVNLEDGEVQIDNRWVIVPTGIDAQEISVRSLRRDLTDWYRLNLNTGAQGDYVIRLLIQAGAVKTAADAEIDKQAYRLRISDRSTEITGNDAPGLFYGVQTLLQLVRQHSSGALFVPKGTISDWSQLQLRFLHWDTKHHQDRIETLKRYLD
ncbi:MAG: hypothetical protein DMG57_14105 [Acidobacteria bacterium]|nr:MAG: hypothetical protein DMG57_14105 [Acidobacteriota bacterium]